MSDLIVILDIIAAFLLGSLISWLVTYFFIQKIKINQMKTAEVVSLNAARADYYNKGYEAGTENAKGLNSKKAMEHYLTGYAAGVANEKKLMTSLRSREVAQDKIAAYHAQESPGKHSYTIGDDVTEVMPALADGLVKKAPGTKS